MDGTFRQRLVASLRFSRLQILTHAAALLPLFILIWDGLHDQLTANPITEIEDRTGRIGLICLVLSLACTPLNTVFGFRQALKLRRSLGLYGFLYAGLHFLTYAALDFGFDFGLIAQDIVQQRYLLVGFIALLLLIPLALTSTRGWMKRLAMNWKRLHWLVYLAAPLVVLHFFWLVKADMREPLSYGVAVGALLILRIPPVRRFLSSVRYRLKLKFSSVHRTDTGVYPRN